MEACPLPDRPPGDLFQTAIPDRPPAPIHARRGPALDLKQATAAVFYALARGWLAVRQGRSQAATCCIDGPRYGPSATPQETVFEPHELNSCVGGAES